MTVAFIALAVVAIAEAIVHGYHIHTSTAERKELIALFLRTPHAAAPPSAADGVLDTDEADDLKWLQSDESRIAIPEDLDSAYFPDEWVTPLTSEVTE